MAGQGLADAGDVVASAGEVRGCCGELVGVVQFGAQGGEFGARIDAQVLDESGVEGVVDRAGLGGAALAVQGADEQALEALAEGVVGGQGLQLRQVVGGGSEGYVEGEALLQEREAQRRQTFAFALHEGAGQVEERFSVPEREGFGQMRAGSLRLLGRASSGQLVELFDAPQVDEVRFDRQPVATRLGEQDGGGFAVRLQQLAQLGDVRAEGDDGRAGRLLAP